MIRREAVRSRACRPGRGWRVVRSAYSDLRYEVGEIVHDAEQAMARAAMSDRQTGPFVVFHGARPVALPPTGGARRAIAAAQAHAARGAATITDRQASPTRSPSAADPAPARPSI